ncbi:hypothetical protein D8M23_04090 [Rothia sp. HSID18067]|nr:hypothetical protein D8M23_04090 [Rothia sp. HSID18067]
MGVSATDITIQFGYPTTKSAISVLRHFHRVVFGVAPAGVSSPFRHRTAAVLRITHREGAPLFFGVPLRFFTQPAG